MERRKNTRVPFEVTATVHTGGTGISGTVDNLSMKGMRLVTSEALPVGSPLKIRIILSGSTSELSISLKGRAIRQTEAGTAIEFLEMDLDSFTHLRNIIAQNIGAPDAVYQEYLKSIKSKQK
jgi:hypothetical protein